MKKLLYTFLAVSIIFSACTKEEESNISITGQNIVGVWDINSLVYDGVDFTNIIGFQGASFIINSDNTFLQIAIYNGDTETDEGNWELNGSELTLDFDGPVILWSINSFNGSTASLTLVEYLDGGDGAPTSGSATIVKQ